jgi:hypothetical protein
MLVNKTLLLQTDYEKSRQLLFTGLIKFFYEHQYDDKYSTFRDCKLVEEEGYLAYTFYTPPTRTSDNFLIWDCPEEYRFYFEE